MSFSQASTSVTRSRPLRAPAKPTTLSNTASSNAQPISSTTNIPTATSNLALFLTNLRLLGLDEDQEWPGISAAIFSVKDVGGGQKKRVQCVEWALYQLFLLWDQDEAQNKLAPYFPPLDQVMSINLRSALTRLLEQAKKAGVLGRDAVIRKTMLDECKGERLEEVLAVFSSAVLKKLVAERSLNGGSEYRLSISETLSLENRGYTGERTQLHGLILAHKASLSSLLARKRAAQHKYKDFSELLALKERGIARRQEQMKLRQSMGLQTSEAVKSELRRALKMNWTGNDQWLEGLLYDSTSSRTSGLLGASFDDVWEGVQQGRISDLEEQSTGLLEQLDQRVRLQQSRVEKWSGFREKLFGNQENIPPPTVKPIRHKSVAMRFNAHQHLSLEKFAPRDSAALKPSDAPAPYANLLSKMKSELDSLADPSMPDISNLLAPKAGQQSQRLVVPMASAEPVSDMSEWEDEPEEVPVPVPAPPPRRPSAIRPPSTVSRSDSSRMPRRQSPKKGTRKARAYSVTEDTVQQRESSPAPPTPAEEKLTVAEPDREASLSVSPPPPPMSPEPTMEMPEDLIPEPSPPLSPTQEEADQILASMSNATPSPMKRNHRHTLSLAERTRLSMARGNPYEDDPPSPVKANENVRQSQVQSIQEASEPGEPGEGGYEDLIARTRRSMVGFEAARQKAQVERRRSQRQSKMMPPRRKDSYFSKLSEEDDHGDVSIAEELMEGNQDAEAIFRSRPRIAASPIPSPTRLENVEDYDEL